MNKPERAPLSQPPKPVDREAKVRDVEEEFEKTIVQFMALLQEKKLDKNKSTKEIVYKNMVFDKLVKSARQVELVEGGKGIMGLAIISLRAVTFVNNRLNELGYEIYKLNKEIKNDSSREGERDSIKKDED